MVKQKDKNMTRRKTTVIGQERAATSISILYILSSLSRQNNDVFVAETKIFDESTLRAKHVFKDVNPCSGQKLFIPMNMKTFRWNHETDTVFAV